MKLLKKNINIKDGSGSILIKPETSEDLWHIYNLIQTGDSIRCTTIRKVIKETSTGSTSSNKRKMMLTIRIEKIDFDIDSIDLRISGIVISENEYVRLGLHHTLSIELYTNILIEKDNWDDIYYNILNEALHPENNSDLCCIVLQPSGLCHICLLTGSLTITKTKIDINIPKKRSISTNHTKAMMKFYDTIYQSFIRHIDIEQMKCIVIGSPGFLKNDLYEYIIQQAIKSNNKIILDNKHKILLCKVSSGHKYSIQELLNDPIISNQMNTTKVVQETIILNKFMRLLDIDPDRAYYGYQHILYALQNLAIETLLITDELFRSSNIIIRKQYVTLVDDIKKNNGNVTIFSIMNTSGQQLQQISGIAAILRFPLVDLIEYEEQYNNINHNNNNDTYDGVQLPISFMNHDDDDDDEEEDDVYDPQRRLLEDIKDMGL